MCGIVGIFRHSSGKDYSLVLRKWWENLAHRGEDSYGGILKTSDGFYLLKSLSKERVLEKIEEFSTIEWGIFHNRKASIGSSTSIDLAHPVFYQKEKAFSAVIHNGTKKALYEVFESYGNSDTEVILSLLREFKSSKFIKTILKNTGVVFFFDFVKDRMKVFFHKDSSRTLYWNSATKLLASEPLEVGIWHSVSSIDFELFYDGNNFNFSLFEGSVLKVNKIVECDICGRKFANKIGCYCNNKVYSYFPSLGRIR